MMAGDDAYFIKTNKAQWKQVEYQMHKIIEYDFFSIFSFFYILTDIFIDINWWKKR